MCLHLVHKLMCSEHAEQNEDVRLPQVNPYHFDMLQLEMFASQHNYLYLLGGVGEIPWCFSQVKGTIEDEVADGK